MATRTIWIMFAVATLLAFAAIGVFPLTEHLPDHPVRWVAYGVFLLSCSTLAGLMWVPRRDQDERS